MPAEFAWIQGEHHNGCAGLTVVKSGAHPDPWDWERPTLLGEGLRVLSCRYERCDAKLVARGDIETEVLRAFASLRHSRA